MKLFGIILGILIALLFLPGTIQAEVLGTCYKNGCGPNMNAKYEYTAVQCVQTCVGDLCTIDVQDGPYRGHEVSTPENQNTPFGWQCDPAPANCGDYNGYSTELNCVGGGGTDDPTCPGNSPRAGSCSGTIR